MPSRLERARSVPTGFELFQHTLIDPHRGDEVIGMGIIGIDESRRKYFKRIGKPHTGCFTLQIAESTSAQKRFTWNLVVHVFTERGCYSTT